MDVAFLLPEGSLTTDVGYAQKSALTWSAAPETQSAVIMDETTFSVPQSQGRGNCGQAEDQQFPKKDYLAVQTGGYGEDRRGVSFKYIGGSRICHFPAALTMWEIKPRDGEGARLWARFP